jgi:ectoine hydroxylase-related dioxygenase (phytanoyl-CoA dioxygenase family)
MATVTTTDGYLAGRRVDDAQIHAWCEEFDRDGYLFLKDVLPPALVAELKDDLDAELARLNEKRGEAIGIDLAVRMFEHSRANLSLFDLEPVASFAEELIGRDDSGPDWVHVMHNNSFKTFPGGGGITRWHQDDKPHYLVTGGEPPRNVRLPVLVFTANYYLTDVTGQEHGATEVVPGSHLFGKPCPEVLEGTEWQERVVHPLGKAGSLVMFNNPVWHRGGPNTSDRFRYITQVSYARRIVGHKYFPFMNYEMPEHAYADADPRLKRLLGFLPTGPYG